MRSYTEGDHIIEIKTEHSMYPSWKKLRVSDKLRGVGSHFLVIVVDGDNALLQHNDAILRFPLFLKRVIIMGNLKSYVT